MIFDVELMEAQTIIDSDIEETVVSIHGMSAYQIAVEHGFVGTEEEWLDSLVGPAGPQGEKGDTGDPGYTPQKGVDYWTEAEKEELIDEITETVTGDIDAALDNIIAIQNELLGVSE